ncbi:MAG TPA: tRNA (cytidine(34)-2'-O)-methyltransferase [Acidobacteriota bacterium]|nr:tRNA (cytidine(34)-2'-O)-methyltransferase [Acidobacteriota bacterium]
MRIALIHPQIPPNTGNVARLCAATRTELHLVRPLGFEISDRHLRRAGLDYWEFLDLAVHDDWEAFLDSVPEPSLHFFSKKARRSYVEADLSGDVSLVFGSETQGLHQALWQRFPKRFWRIPLFHPGVRSLNLSSAVAAAAYESLRQQGRLRDQH